jgi:cytochrome c-type biogenesis protein CcmH
LILFWLAAAVLSAGAAILMLRSAARTHAAREGGAARAAPLLCLAAPLAAAGLYLVVGSPGTPDQAYAERLRAWRAAPETLGPTEAAAVLERIAVERPRDAQARFQLGRARLAGGDAFGAARAFEQASVLAPGEAVHWTALAQALLALETPSPAEARRALARAEALAPGDPEIGYWRGQAAVAGGDRQAAAAEWRAVAAALPPSDPRRAALQSEIAALDGAKAAAPVDSAIEGMVAGLAARLRAEPIDSAGWARLARAYAVLGREAELAAALTEVRRLFAGRPEVIQSVEASAAEGRARSPLRAGG